MSQGWEGDCYVESHVVIGEVGNSLSEGDPVDIRVVSGHMDSIRNQWTSHGRLIHRIKRSSTPREGRVRGYSVKLHTRGGWCRRQRGGSSQDLHRMRSPAAGRTPSLCLSRMESHVMRSNKGWGKHFDSYIRCRPIYVEMQHCELGAFSEIGKML